MATLDFFPFDITLTTSYIPVQEVCFNFQWSTSDRRTSMTDFARLSAFLKSSKQWIDDFSFQGKFNALNLVWQKRCELYLSLSHPTLSTT